MFVQELQFEGGTMEYVDKPCMQWTGVPNFEVPPSMVVASNRWVSSAITTIATGHRLQVNPAVFFRHTIYGWLYGYIIIYIYTHLCIQHNYMTISYNVRPPSYKLVYKPQ